MDNGAGVAAAENLVQSGSGCVKPAFMSYPWAIGGSVNECPGA